MTDCKGVTWSYKRPFLAVKKAPEDAPLLLRERTIGEISINISLRTKEAGGNRWQFHLPSNSDPIQDCVRVELAKTFQKRLKKGPKVYALLEYNPLLYSTGSTDNENELLSTLKEYADVFSSQAAEKLAPNREGVDLAIKIQEGQEPPYGPLYPLSRVELEVLQRYL